MMSVDDSCYRQEFGYTWELFWLSLLLVKRRCESMKVGRQEFLWELFWLSLLLVKRGRALARAGINGPVNTVHFIYCRHISEYELYNYHGIWQITTSIGVPNSLFNSKMIIGECICHIFELEKDYRGKGMCATFSTWKE